ncbi:hypothetical protein [Fulvimonas yonginensis]|uniref:Uncharacterized protein n=1 Tax=Fulvimonas yonginensis TaxID=1495200 RepID=A0ABU8JA32_9GAMM
MSRRSLLLASLLVAASAQAQSVAPAPQASDSWDRPVPAASIGSREAAPAATRDATASHFKFKERRSRLPDTNAAQEHSGKAGVGGMGELDRSGRPAVNCPQTPMDPACH